MRLFRGKITVGIILLAALFGGLALASRSRHAAHSQQAGVYYCPMHPTYTSDHPGDCPICSMKLVKREEQAQTKEPQDLCTLHNCPMAHDGRPCPMLVVSKPGEEVRCPVCGTHVAGPTESASKKILYWTDPMMPSYKSDKPGKSPMGMDLVPVYEQTDGSAGSSAAPEGYAAVLLSPQKRQLIGIKTSPARRRQMVRTLRTAGRIAYDPELYQAEQEYLQAIRVEMPAQAKGLAEAARMRLRLLGLSDSFIQQMSSWEGPDQRLLLADNQGQVWVYAAVYELDLPLIKEGQQIRVENAVPGGKELEGKIVSVDSVLDPATRSARARALITDPDRVLRPEMYVNVSIPVPMAEVLVVPAEAVFDTGTRKILFVDKGEGLLEPREVTVGARGDGLWEIVRGVSEGEPVVVNGNFLVDSESRLKSALEGAASPGHPHGQ